MELNKLHIAFAATCFIAGAIIGAGLRSCTAKTPEAPDPIIIRDTIKANDPADIADHTKPKYVIKHDTLWLPKPEAPCDSTDSLCNGRVTDSIPVEIPIMCYEYRDTFQTDSSRIELGVQFSGYDAKIDSVDLQYQFNIPPRTIVKKKGWGQFFGIGVGAGYGVSFVGNPYGSGTVVNAAPEIGVHIVYGWGYHW